MRGESRLTNQNVSNRRSTIVGMVAFSYDNHSAGGRPLAWKSVSRRLFAWITSEKPQDFCLGVAYR